MIALHLAGTLEPFLDEVTYLYLAACWEHFGFYTDSGLWLWPPGYPYFLKVMLGEFGYEGIHVAKLVQCAAAGVIGYSTMLIAATVFDRRAGLLAGGIWCVYLPMIGFSHYLWPETLFLVVFVPALYLLVRWSREAPERGAARWLLPSGVLLGVAMLIKESAVYLSVALAGLMFLRYRSAPLEGLRSVTLFGLAVLVVVFPWSLRNYELYGTVTPVGASLGSNCWVGISSRYRNFDYPGNYPVPGRDFYGDVYDGNDWRYRAFIDRPREAQWDRARPRREKAPVRNVVQLSDEDTRLAIEHIGRYPLVFLRGRVKRLSNWSSPTSFFVRHLAGGQYEGVASNRGARRVLLAAALGLSIAVLLAAIPGILSALRGPPAGDVLVCTLLYALLPALLVGMSRHRMFVEPVLIVLAAGFLARPTRLRWTRSSLGAVALGWLALGFLWYLAAPEVLGVAEVVWG